MDKVCKRCLSGFCWRSKHTYKHTNMNTSRGTQRPGTTIEPQLPIRGHYCQTLERKLPGAHWLPTYGLQQFNYKFDNVKYCTHSMWQYSTSDNKHQEQLAEKCSEKAHFVHIFTPRVVFASTLLFVVGHSENDWAVHVQWDPNGQNL